MCRILDHTAPSDGRAARRSRPPGTLRFTLIELLVVITIIVVLLALLTPALDEAIYQTELTQCAAQIDMVVTGTLTYAMEHNRRYIDRPASTHQTIRIGIGVWDIRQKVRDYFPPNALTCPLSGEVDLDRSVSLTFGSYDYWAGWAFWGEKGLNRIGDEFEWTSIGQNNQSITDRYTVLVSDREVAGPNAQLQSAHPDRDGILQQYVRQDEENPWGTSVAGAANTGGNITIAMWRNPAHHERGLVDRNFGYQNGAVVRLTDLEIKSDGEPDDRMSKAPMYTNPASAANHKAALPHD